jgi:hypothetical protein
MIDRGVLLYTTTDFDGLPVPTGIFPDIGAYELP